MQINAINTSVNYVDNTNIAFVYKLHTLGLMCDLMPPAESARDLSSLVEVLNAGIFSSGVLLPVSVLRNIFKYTCLCAA